MRYVCVALMDAGVDSREGHSEAGLTGHRKHSRDSNPLRISHYVFNTARQMESCSKGNVSKHFKCLINESKTTQREDRVRFALVFCVCFQVFTRYGKCYTFNSGNTGTPLVSVKGGMGNGLEIMLDIQQDEYLPVWGETDDSSFEAGIKVQIHSQDEPPFIDQLGFGVAPGFQTFVSCQEQRLVYLPAPWGSCKSTPPSSDYFKAYSISACRTDCETRYLSLMIFTFKVTIIVLNIHMHNILVGDAQYCTPVLYKECAHPALDFLVERDSDYCSCDTPCNITRYSKELSFVKIPSKASVKYLAKKYSKSEKYITENVLVLDVFFEALNYETIEQRKAYEVAGLLGCAVAPTRNITTTTTLITALYSAWMMSNVTGSAIAKIVGTNARNNSKFDSTVNMWVFEETVNGRKLTEIINADHENVKYLPGHKLPENVVAVPDLLDAAKSADILLFVIPHQFIGRVCDTMKGKIKPDALGMSLIKGVDEGPDGLKLISEVIHEKLGIKMSVLMGANIANEVADEKFCETTIGCRDQAQGALLKELMQTDHFRVTVVQEADVVEICGALKVCLFTLLYITPHLLYKIRCVIAAVIRLGLMEMISFARLFCTAGSVSPATFLESCGVADLITTCYGGRNRKICYESRPVTEFIHCLQNHPEHQ
ncbi:Acid-sensing ion channel 1A [Labeo rohita]|uniref:Glycerol-3-phosphate dehydrogenase [NAD(+)], cytoplasmic n=1 Tax=Labeo rohita TaxID=84645 RepID=A0ABQ8MGM9_LABRO|nr:Acid-sensing ion channel 1A [Labeo rohita]